MIKLKVSYTDPAELAELVKRLRVDMKRVRKSLKQEGQYKKAYIDLTEEPEKT